MDNCPNPPFLTAAILSPLNPVVDFTIQETLQEVQSHRTGNKAIKTELASLEISPGYMTIVFTEEAISIISALEDLHVLPPAGIILPEFPRRYQNALLQSPLVPISSIAFPHCGKVVLCLNHDQENGLVCSLEDEQVLVRQWDPFHPRTSGCHSCVPILYHNTKDPCCECMYEDIPFACLSR